jgi:hypothetical protein
VWHGTTEPPHIIKQLCVAVMAPKLAPDDKVRSVGRDRSRRLSRMRAEACSRAVTEGG